MKDDCLSLPIWAALESAERESVARSVARAHPKFEFLGIRQHAQGDQAHKIAFFDWSGIEFALIPGAKVELGYDATRRWVPSPEEDESYEEQCSSVRAGAEYRQSMGDGDREFASIVPQVEMPSLSEYIGNHLTPHRCVRLAPFLLEVSASQAGIRHLEPDHPDFDPSLADHLLPGIGGCSVLRNGRRLQCRMDRDGSLRIWEEWSITHAEILAAMAADGFRLPTSDEWEFACGAGSRTLFRWGDHSPAEYYHPGQPVSEWERREAMHDMERLVALIQQLQDAPRDYDDPSTDPNAFGLLISDRSGRSELCLEQSIMRGGDDGRGACGGMDRFTACWLPQATAFYLDCTGEVDSRQGVTAPRVRRVFPLAG